MADAPHTTDPADASAMSDFFTPAYQENRRQELAKNPEPWGMDDSDPQGPCGHAAAIRTSTRLTSDFRKTYRKDAVDVTPQQVIDVLNAAGVKSWVLMGLHGYVGYMPMPRATQDVDVMVSGCEWDRVRQAIASSMAAANPARVRPSPPVCGSKRRGVLRRAPVRCGFVPVVTP